VSRHSRRDERKSRRSEAPLTDGKGKEKYSPMKPEIKICFHGKDVKAEWKRRETREGLRGEKKKDESYFLTE